MDDLLQEFIAETRETLEALSGEIVMWEADPSERNRLDAIFRFVHTVKGSCGFLDLPRLSRLSHAAEDVLADVRAGNRRPDTALVNAVLAVVDRIGEIIEAIDAGASLDDSGEDLLIAALEEGGEAPEPTAAAVLQRAPTRSVRLNVDLLDRMMGGMSDMVLARNELARRLRDDDVDPQVEAALERLSVTVAEMRDTVTRTRMQKIDALFSAMPRMVRDTSAELGKSVALVIEGADVELDREMIEMMRDPLVHIIRNAIDHGIETPMERRAVGKRENGRLTVSARQSGNQIVIELADDGRGIDVERLIAKLASEGTRSEAELRALSERAQLALIFEPGITTKADVSTISGRGVGMDIVRANIEQIGGRIELANTPGKGLSVAIHVPLTLSIMSTIVVGVRDQCFALSRQSIEEIITVRGDTIRIDMLGDTAVATVRDRRLPLLDLAGVLGFDQSDPAAATMLAIVSVTGGSYALAVDSVVDTEELVIKPAAPAVMASGLYAGQTLPDSGRPMLLLDCAGVAASAGLVFSRERADDVDPQSESGAAIGMPALLFLDLDGIRRAAPLDIIDRVELTTTDMIRVSAGRLRLSVDGAIIPLAAQGSVDGRDQVAILRMTDDRSEIGYVIAEALDIITLTESLKPAMAPGPVAGVISVDGEPIEMLDIHWLFANTADDHSDADAAPLCLLAGDEAKWMDIFLRPILEGAGYRVVTRLPAAGKAAVALTMGDHVPALSADVPLVCLRREQEARGSDDTSIYRYDRERLLDALAVRRAGTKGR